MEWGLLSRMAIVNEIWTRRIVTFRSSESQTLPAEELWNKSVAHPCDTSAAFTAARTASGKAGAALGKRFAALGAFLRPDCARLPVRGAALVRLSRRLREGWASLTARGPGSVALGKTVGSKLQEEGRVAGPAFTRRGAGESPRGVACGAAPSPAAARRRPAPPWGQPDPVRPCVGPSARLLGRARRGPVGGAVGPQMAVKASPCVSLSLFFFLSPFFFFFTWKTWNRVNPPPHGGAGRLGTAAPWGGSLGLAGGTEPGGAALRQGPEPGTGLPGTAASEAGAEGGPAALRGHTAPAAALQRGSWAPRWGQRRGRAGPRSLPAPAPPSGSAWRWAAASPFSGEGAPGPPLSSAAPRNRSFKIDAEP